MAKQDEFDRLEKEKEKAAAAGNFAAFQKAHRRSEALRGGASAINGLLDGAATGGVMAPVAAMDPVSNPAQAANEVAMIQKYGVGGVKPQTLAQNDALKADKYNQFLLDQGISPATIGNAAISEDGIMEVPSLKQEETARNLSSGMAGLHNRYTIAASRSRDPVTSLQLQERADEMAPQVAGRSAQGNLQYWLNRLRGTVQTQRTNGFASR